MAKTILKKKVYIRGLKPSDFKTCYKSIVIKRVWYWQKIDIKINGRELRVQM